jgi:DsbC/DsbD-like thiol-disulfide interchange protein
MRTRIFSVQARGAACLALLCTLAPAAAAAGLASAWAEGHNSRARLIAGHVAGSGLAGVEVQMPEGWKTYWRNPGDAGGVPPSFDWSKSENLAGAEVLYPAPKRFTDRSGDTVGYKGTVVFPVRLTPKDPAKPIDLRLTLDYGVCKDICIPAEALLTLAVEPQQAGEAPPELAAALDRVPAPEATRRPGDPLLKQAAIDRGGEKPRLLLEAEFPGGAEHGDIFVEAPPGLYLPLPKKIADDGAGHATFAVDLTDGIKPEDLKSQTLKATLISSKGQSETAFSVD